ncbi:hypothetical protein Pfo_010580 [Paulownia fortunei]|nr:hypothetical protein Pfo_010580 [Paulownia fortunei]
MASVKRNYVLALYMVLLLLQQHFGLISAYNLQKIRPPAPVQALIKPNPPATYGFRFNRYKKTQADAFRPTTPGNSPGMGHNVPPHDANLP